MAAAFRVSFLNIYCMYLVPFKHASNSFIRKGPSGLFKVRLRDFDMMGEMAKKGET